MDNQEAIKLITEFLEGDEYENPSREEVKAMEYAIQALKKERPQGEWIKSDIETIGGGYFWKYRCSICNKEGGEANYCSNCGAQMVGGEP